MVQPSNLACSGAWVLTYVFLSTQAYRFAYESCITFVTQGAITIVLDYKIQDFESEAILGASLTGVKWSSEQDCPRPMNVGGEFNHVLMVVGAAAQASNVKSIREKDVFVATHDDSHASYLSGAS